MPFFLCVNNTLQPMKNLLVIWPKLQTTFTHKLICSFEVHFRAGVKFSNWGSLFSQVAASLARIARLRVMPQ